MGKQCRNVCVTDGEYKPLQQILPRKKVKRRPTPLAVVLWTTSQEKPQPHDNSKGL